MIVGIEETVEAVGLVGVVVIMDVEGLLLSLGGWLDVGLAEEVSSVVLPVVTALLALDYVPLREGIIPFQFCNLLNSATYE